MTDHCVPTLDGADRSGRWRAGRWIAAAAAVLAIGVGAVFGTRLGQDPTLVDSPLIGQLAPTQPLPYLEGEGSLSLADLRGQIVVVNSERRTPRCWRALSNANPRRRGA